MELAAGGQPATDYAATDPAVATFLLSALNHEVTHVALGGGRLHLAFGDAGHISVAPDPNFESWNIRSSDHLLIVCQPGGQLATWAANTSR